MRTLYFDIDGSLLIGETGEPKPTLSRGAFERAVQRSRIGRLVCVGSFVDAGRAAKEADPLYDIHGALLEICGGVFEDEDWFRANTLLVRDSYYRAAEVDLSADWWYLDDLAEYYFQAAYRQDAFESNIGKRILVPTPDGDGRDVLNWLDKIQ